MWWRHVRPCLTRYQQAVMHSKHCQAALHASSAPPAAAAALLLLLLRPPPPCLLHAHSDAQWHSGEPKLLADLGCQEACGGGAERSAAAHKCHKCGRPRLDLRQTASGRQKFRLAFIQASRLPSTACRGCKAVAQSSGCNICAQACVPACKPSSTAQAAPPERCR